MVWSLELQGNVQRWYTKSVVPTKCARNLFHKYVQTIGDCKAFEIVSEPSDLAIRNGGDYSQKYKQ
jgi:hypothetical protein